MGETQAAGSEHHVEVVGRDAELALLGGFLAAGSPAHALVLTGGPGMQAATGFQRLGLRLDAARLLLSLGCAQRRRRKWGAARDSLEAAVVAFDALGSPGWAEQARSELARVGARRPSPTGELTPTERRVVELAADGRANKEIARGGGARRGTSPRTSSTSRPSCSPTRCAARRAAMRCSP